MLIVKYLLLGVVQGLTEFLPVSSSAHLVIFQDLFRIPDNQIILSIILHLGSLAALLVFLFKDIRRLLEIKVLLYLSLATAVTAVIVVLGQDFLEGSFGSAQKPVLPLFITGIVLLCTKGFASGRRGLSDLKIGDALWLGLVQGAAVIPGVSRSGTTIAALLFRGMERTAAFKFSVRPASPT